jgi:hypothetical protein
MEIETDAVIIHSMNSIEKKRIRVNDLNKTIILHKLIEQNEKAKRIIKNLYDEGQIKSLSRPKNKKMQNQLNEIIKAKRILNNSIEKIKISFR